MIGNDGSMSRRFRMALTLPPTGMPRATQGRRRRCWRWSHARNATHCDRVPDARPSWLIDLRLGLVFVVTMLAVFLGKSPRAGDLVTFPYVERSQGAQDQVSHHPLRSKAALDIAESAMAFVRPARDRRVA